MKASRTIWVAVSFLVMATLVVSYATPNGAIGKSFSDPSLSTPTPEIKDTRDLSKYGIADYNAPQIENPQEFEKRRQINQRYDKQEWVVSTINNPRAGGVGKITDDPLPPLFPIDESALIVVGEVVTANAFLSNDKGGVYTEFTIRVDEVLKNTGMNNPKKVIADREGGVVVYPNGQRVRYGNSDRGLPLLGTKYLFFLTKDYLRPNYEILTSYDLSGNRVYPMETGHPFDEFKDATKTTFIEIVRNKLRRPGKN